ncbi:MAG: metalloregulator ArsR/SmtB family transcription factor [Caulobacteraceae bacterium]
METLSALADPVRRDIVAMLAERERTAGEIASRFEITGPAISRHLKVLRQAGLAKVRGDAQRRIYSLDPKPLDELQAWITTQKNIWARQLDALGAHLDKMAEEEGA